jgi:hypothetical protein
MPSNDTLAERIARMEQRLDHIDLAISKYKGFIGGVLFIVSCLWAFVKMGIPYILKLTGKQ